jgi:hypothetical protein
MTHIEKQVIINHFSKKINSLTKKPIVDVFFSETTKLPDDPEHQMTTSPQQHIEP